MVTIRYFAAARAARGVDREDVALTGSLDAVLREIVTQHSDSSTGGLSLAEVFDRCTFLINGQRSERSAELRDGDQLDVLPPFAGG
ncbi:MoaD/ThiS family protein [Corynebacterium dentalis]|uniref:MoaD/ThiS family protein n=1 Tax=Corynebacterium dentalis TaxID=2014528 RepID=UPI00289C5331|nr:MoaD/ThiS family protein [Corynebacterium dentalis]